LFSKVEIPAENIHEFQTENGDAETVAKLMEQEIRQVFGIEKQLVAPSLKAMHEPQLPMQFPRFDLIFLGMGADGHTASLFPETKALQEDKRLVAENYVPKFETFRLTFTFPTINNARNIIFLIAGADKKETWHEVLDGEFQPEKLPSQSVKPINGNLLILTNI
jgi:6-phosphogluconolactonase